MLSLNKPLFQSRAAMNPKDNIDLARLMTDSLSLEANMASPARHMFPKCRKNPYSHIIDKEPLDILGETKFGQPKHIPEDVIGTPIQEFLRDAHVFITGATGFIGKVLIEKLVRSVPHLGHVYLLIRSKRGLSSQERFTRLLEDKVFSRMKAEVPHYADKITVVDGDVSEHNLGLSEADRQTLIDNISVVFHSAADVRLIQSLRGAISTNVLGSKEVMDLAKEMKILKAYVHVSTAYSNCVRQVIPETVFKLSLHYKEIMKDIDSKTDEDLERDTSRILQGWPNTYTFSKAVCEDMVEEEAGGLPLIIFRPSVICPTYNEPVRGWTDNLYGLTGVMTGAGLGVVHCFRADMEVVVDYVPVDFVTNCMIAAAWGIATSRVPDTVPVYNFTISPVKPKPLKSIVNFALGHTDAFPFYQSIWYTSLFVVQNYYLYAVFHFLLHTIPGIFFDFLAIMFGKKPRLTKLYATMFYLSSQFSNFTFTSWEFKNENVIALWKALDHEDRKLFNFDLGVVDTLEHFLVSKLGVKYYYFKENLEDLPAAQRKNTWLYWLHVAFKTLCGLAVLKLLVIVAHVLPI